MSEFKGTKGKWYLQEFTDNYTNIIRCDNGFHKTLFLASTSQTSGGEARANAQLMSCAPEMLEMLEAIQLTLDDGRNVESGSMFHDILRNLIKSATTI
ncbi:hypothetical protein [Sphingobacterium hungaricum]|uniref:Uncharacterized protein n=1 Tax=Sphingobacterium hungaricum TaxID=2082723 RepID=A0A928YNY9_9SPHI|nr:hypothetical protein [Sphingobacterium hungaricum]MBE8712556.1 hypothetical protein [Sphingobacterium hungaricum]